MTEPIVKRRRFLSEPGDQPLMTADPVDYIEKFEAFIDATGIATERVVALPLARFPLPVSVKTDAGTLERWSTIKPEMMWHPLFWLPAHTALRYQYKAFDPDTGVYDEELEVESDEVWAIRVGLELVYSGMYDPITGTWLDVLAYHGIDADSPADQARIQRWQAGEPDPVLDGIDLSYAFVKEDDPEWAFREAIEAGDVLVPAQWGLTAEGLISAIEDQIELNPSDENRRKVIAVLGDVAVNALRTVPEDPDTEINASEYISAIVDASAYPDSDPLYLTNHLVSLLKTIQEDFAPYVAALRDADDQQLNGVA